MADNLYCIRGATLTSIGDAIRAKTGTSDKIDPNDMPAAIEGIEGSGGAEGCATVTFMDGDAVLLSRPVYIGDDCPDPVAQGRIDTPTKDSTIDTVYTFNGWSGSLEGITEDTTVEAVYEESVREYTVRFYDGETLLHTEQVPYGGSSSYVYNKNGYTFNGWAPAPAGVTSDIDCLGTWVETGEIQDSWDAIIASVDDGTYASKYNVGMYKPLDLGAEGVVNMQIVALDTDVPATGTGTLAITWIAKELLATKKAIHGDGAAVVAFDGTDIYSWLNSTLNALLPASVQSGIKAARKATQFSQSATYTGQTKLPSLKIWLPSLFEVGVPVTSGGYDVSYPAVYFDDETRQKCLAGTDTPAIWWTRDDHNHTRNFHISATGTRSSEDQTAAQGICFGFCI